MNLSQNDILYQINYSTTIDRQPLICENDGIEFCCAIFWNKGECRFKN